jgi:hypothetical protein
VANKQIGKICQEKERIFEGLFRFKMHDKNDVVEFNHPNIENIAEK